MVFGEITLDLNPDRKVGQLYVAALRVRSPETNNQKIVVNGPWPLLNDKVSVRGVTKGNEIETTVVVDHGDRILKRPGRV